MEQIKLTFIGDIMCEKPFLRAAKKREWDFSEAFCGLKGLFSNSDYVVGNLETVFAGKEARFTHGLYSFNAPDSFAYALKNAGIDMVSTINNHSLDRGVEGLRRTLDILDQAGIAHVGTYRTREEAEKDVIIEIGGIRFGFLAYTYGTNSNINKQILSDEESFCAELLQPQCSYQASTSVLGRFKEQIPIEFKTQLKKLVGKEYKNITVDQLPDTLDMKWLQRIEMKVDSLQKKCDHIIALIHSGGQFNRQPGSYSPWFMDFFRKNGVNLIVGNHPHIVQKMERKDGGVQTYCLGNVSISPSSIYVPMENHPDYSVALHLFFSKEEKQLTKVTASILKILEDANGFLRVRPVDEIWAEAKKDEADRIMQDAREVMEHFLGKPLKEFLLQQEWELDRL